MGLGFLASFLGLRGSCISLEPPWDTVTPSGPLGFVRMDGGIKLCGAVVQSLEPVLLSLLSHLVPLSFVGRKDGQSLEELIAV